MSSRNFNGKYEGKYDEGNTSRYENASLPVVFRLRNRTRCNVSDRCSEQYIHPLLPETYAYTRTSLCAFVLPLSTNFAAEKATSTARGEVGGWARFV